MNQDGGTEQSSDYETSDAAASSLNNSLSEEEFSIESSNIDSGGLKLTISFRKKSSEDDTDYSAGANLNRSKQQSASLDPEENHFSMEKQVRELDSNNAYIQKKLIEKDIPKTLVSFNDHTSTIKNDFSYIQTSTTIPTATKLTHRPSASNERQDSVLFISTSDESTSDVKVGLSSVDVSKTCESLKSCKHFKQDSVTCSSSLHDAHDPLLRLDTLPNVSPDSGIISLDESPFGNESPNSVVSGELSADLQHCNQVSSAVSIQCGVKRSEPSTPCQVYLDDHLKTNVNLANSQDCREHAVEISNTNSCEAVVNSPLEQKMNASSKQCTNSDSIQVLKSNLSASTNGNGVILSSPHKISQTMGRKKRGRPPKQKKTLLLKHKKSTIYSGLYGDTSVQNNVGNSLDKVKTKDGSIRHNSEPGAKEKCGLVGSKSSSASLKKKFVNCDIPCVTKRSPGRPKGSISKNKNSLIVFCRTFRNVSHGAKSVKSNEPSSGIASVRLHSASTRHKRPRGRPRKNDEDYHSKPILNSDAGDNTDLHLSVSKSNLTNVKKKHFRKRVFTQRKRKPQSIKSNNNIANQTMEKAIKNIDTTNDRGKSVSVSHKPIKSFSNSCAGKNKAELGASKSKPLVSPEQPEFQDNDLHALLRSVKSSIFSQFTNEEPNNDIIENISFDNPFRVLEPPPFPKMTQVEPPKIVKPKAKKPKLHVMMRRTKRKKRKKITAPKPVKPEAPPPPPEKLNVFSTVSPLKKVGKFTVIPQKKPGTFGSPTSEKKLSFFTSCVQPSKILATSRLNVFRSGTGVEEAHRSGTPTDTDQPDFFDRRNKKRHRLLYRKSKHKNIIDPVFAAKLDMLVSGLNGMAISENPADTYIRVRPGEMPLPSIFRVIKIDLNKKAKDRVLASEAINLDRSKPRKETPSPYEATATAFKPIPKSGRKKSSTDIIVEQRDHSSISDSSDQWLPPKKRHRLVNLETSPFNSPTNSLNDFGSIRKESKAFNLKKKGRRPRKTSGQEEYKNGEKMAQCRLNKQLASLELTIDTSSYTTGGSSVCVSSLSPCPSRLSTRSSTLPSLSSPSPTGSVGFRSRHYSKSSYTLACPLHSLTSSGSDKSTCAECQLLEQSVSPVAMRTCRTTLRSLSSQAIESNFSCERPANSSESSPVLKETLRHDMPVIRNARKRRKSSNLSAEDSDSSPPRLEKNSSLSPLSYRDNNFFSEPPEITNSPFRNHGSPRRQASNRHTAVQLNENSCVVPKKKMASVMPTQRVLRHTSPNKTPMYSTAKKVCNKPAPAPSSSWGEIQTSEYEPLPLEHCTKRKLVEEIKSVLACDSDEESLCSDDDTNDPSFKNIAVSGQLPRKRYQRVGLFSDFYKDDEPRKRCENMVKCRDKLLYVKEEHEFGLIPQPLHIGQYYVRLVKDFQLPYDIWWQHLHNQLPKKQEPKIKFRTIRTNVYTDCKVNNRKLETPLCNCTGSAVGGKGCQEDCLNRMIYTECTSLCALGENCDNQKIQKHEWVPGLEKFLTKDRGFGVRTRTFVKSGQFILEYLGEVVSETEFRRRMMEEYSEECHHYALHLDSGSVIDGYRMGNIGRYVNHSCKPNCEMQKWNVNGLYRMVLFALRDIEPGEELSYDYNFDPFNQETQQECRCGSADCRGVIGGKTQRSNSNAAKPEKMDDGKDKRKSKLMNKKLKDKSSENVQVQPLAKPMTFKERCYARKHRTFLVRNVDKVRNQRNPGQEYAGLTKEEINVLDCNKLNPINSDVMLTHLNERSVKTRLAAYAKDNPEMARRHQLAQIFDKMLTELLSLKDEDGNNIVSPLMSLPSRKKQPQYYQVVREPIDLSMIKQRVKTGYYDHLSSFNADIMLLFSNVELYCGPKSDMGQVILKLRRVLNCVKTDVASQIDELLGSKTTKNYMDAELEKQEQVSCKGYELPEEDIIRCICGVTRDEGLMLQCEKCMRWQHCDCVRASGKEEHYLCDRCEPRYYDPEILLIPPPHDAMPDCTHYMTVVKDDVQYAVGDCVYVMRDCKRTSSGTPLRSSHRLMASVNPDKLDVFRLEQLWKDPKGERFASGTPYLRPQETFHEPTRKFYHNELFRTPNFEIIPMELVMGKCIVMDPNTYCKGRPKGFKEQDIYICEYRVDKTAHLFHKIQKIWYPINTGRFCFDWFNTKLNIRRTFLPHEVPEEYKRKAERNLAATPILKMGVKQEEKYDIKKVSKSHTVSHGKVKIDESIKNDLKLKAQVKVNVKKGALHKTDVFQSKEDLAALLKLKEAKKKEKKMRLDKILTKLLNNIPGKQKVDLTYLLEEGKRVRKKVTK